MSILAHISHAYGHWTLKYSVVFPGERHGRIFLHTNPTSRPRIICESIDSAGRQEQSSYLQQALTEREGYL